MKLTKKFLWFCKQREIHYWNKKQKKLNVAKKDKSS